jgi:hypothetical protein
MYVTQLPLDGVCVVVCTSLCFIMLARFFIFIYRIALGVTLFIPFLFWLPVRSGFYFYFIFFNFAIFFNLNNDNRCGFYNVRE